MSVVVANMSMSLDGFVEDRDGAVDELFRWYGSGSEVVRMPGDDREFRTSPESARELRETVAGVGALVCGRRLYDLARGWNGSHPVGAPVFVVTHDPPSEWPRGSTPFTFVTDGIEAAVAAAKEAAGPKAVAVASANVARQCLDAGLLDAIKVDLIPVLLGAGKPFFAGIEAHVRLDDPKIIQGAGVTHLTYAVRRGS